MNTTTATKNKPYARVGDMSTQMGYESVEGITKDKEEPFCRGSSIISVEGFVFKGGGGSTGGRGN